MSKSSKKRSSKGKGSASSTADPAVLWDADPREVLRVDAGFDLAGFDRGGRPGFTGSKKDAAAVIDERAPLLAELQERLFAEGRSGGHRSVLCVVQGIDTAGKGGVARHVMSLVDPQGVALRSFGPPTIEERRHSFLWRIRRALPPVGRIGVFDRSHYEDVLVARVDHLVPEAVWQRRYEQINRFEKQLVDEGVVVLKFALMVSKDEQGVRLMERLDRPDKLWKFSPGDLDTRAKWDEYQQAYQDVFSRTSTEWAPWYVLPANRKWYTHLAITEILTRTLVDMDPGWPVPDWDPATMRERLAASMTPRALRRSLSGTRAGVEQAVDADERVRLAAAEVLRQHGADDPDAESATARSRRLRKQAKAGRRQALADLAHVEDQKRRLLDAARERS